MMRHNRKTGHIYCPTVEEEVQFHQVIRFLVNPEAPSDSVTDRLGPYQKCTYPIDPSLRWANYHERLMAIRIMIITGLWRDGV